MMSDDHRHRFNYIETMESLLVILLTNSERDYSQQNKFSILISDIS